ncbi:MAG: hypothetical protein ACOYCA_04300 [Eggerthellaceae bacterium]
MANKTKKDTQKPRYYSNREQRKSDELITKREFLERRKRNRKRRGIVMLVLLIVLTIVGAVWFQTTQHHDRVAVNFNLDVPSYNATTDTEIPFHIEGTNVIGDNVAQNFYLTTDETEVKLLEGEYTITAIGSPITQSGTLYTYPTKQYKISINDKGEISGDELSFTYTPIDAKKVSDEQIQAAYQWLIDSGLDEEKAQEYRQAAINARK